MYYTARHSHHVTDQYNTIHNTMAMQRNALRTVLSLDLVQSAATYMGDDDQGPVKNDPGSRTRAHVCTDNRSRSRYYSEEDTTIK